MAGDSGLSTVYFDAATPALPRLLEFPELIRQAELRVLECIEGVREAQLWYDRTEAQIEMSVAFDSDLKNEAQRKAVKADMMVGEEMVTRLEGLNAWKRDLMRAEIELAFLKNQFKVALVLAQPS